MRCSSNGVATGEVSFDLGSTQTIDALALWNGANSLGIQGFTLIAADNSAFTGATTLGSYTAAFASSITSAQDFTIAATTAEFFRIQITSNQGSILTPIGQVAFGGVAPAAVPEPSSPLLILSGAGAFAVRKLRGKAKTAA